MVDRMRRLHSFHKMSTISGLIAHLQVYSKSIADGIYEIQQSPTFDQAVVERVTNRINDNKRILDEMIKNLPDFSFNKEEMDEKLKLLLEQQKELSKMLSNKLNDANH
jgi:dsDNA-specific endonuclease/ATPase MutS2